MSYEPDALIAYFSNPNVKYPDASGCATGIPEGQLKACDESKTINNARVFVTNFRSRNP